MSARAMRGLGFSDEDRGPMVDELRQAMKGTINAGVSWGPEAHKMTAEERAAMFLDIQWAIERGHSNRVELLDSTPIDWRYNLRRDSWTLEFTPSLLKPWIGDSRSIRRRPVPGFP